MSPSRLSCLAGLAIASLSLVASAQPAPLAQPHPPARSSAPLDAGTAPDASASADATTDAAGPDHDATPDADDGKVWASCMQHVPDGVTPPKLTETFPARGLAGYALTLRVVVQHGRGEKVLPNGFRIQNDSDAARALAGAGFSLPHPDGGSGPTLQRRDDADGAVSEIVVNFVALPEQPGRHELVLPPIPVAVSRASGDLITLCTAPHRIVIDEPIANEPNAKPEPNPPPRPQRELWTLARDLTYGGIVGAVIAALVAWLVIALLRRPKPVPPPPPPRPPWEVALEELAAIRGLDLIPTGQLADHVDRVSDTVRRYLGARYGFDGIESTTDEALLALGRVTPPVPVFEGVRALLFECDLVKFARMTPTEADCEQVLLDAETIVRKTMPFMGPGPVEPSPQSKTPDGAARDSDAARIDPPKPQPPETPLAPPGGSA